MIRCLSRLLRARTLTRRRRKLRARVRLEQLWRELGGRPHRTPLLVDTLPKPSTDERDWRNGL